MELNNIQLSPAVVASWYRFSLVDSDAKEITGGLTQTTTSATEWKYLGNNRKNVLLVVQYPATTYLPDEELSFLTAMLNACKLGLEDVAIVNCKNYPGYYYKDYLNHYNSKQILLFGIDPITFGLPVDFPQYQVQSFANCTFLYSPALEERHTDTLFKSKLWVCLKRIFGV